MYVCMYIYVYNMYVCVYVRICVGKHVYVFHITLMSQCCGDFIDSYSELNRKPTFQNFYLANGMPVAVVVLFKYLDALYVCKYACVSVCVCVCVCVCVRACVCV